MFAAKDSLSLASTFCSVCDGRWRALVRINFFFLICGTEPQRTLPPKCLKLPEHRQNSTTWLPINSTHKYVNLCYRHFWNWNKPTILPKINAKFKQILTRKTKNIIILNLKKKKKIRLQSIFCHFHSSTYKLVDDKNLQSNEYYYTFVEQSRLIQKLAHRIHKQ